LESVVLAIGRRVGVKIVWEVLGWRLWTMGSYMLDVWTALSFVFVKGWASW
jgi:hypothetical protein